MTDYFYLNINVTFCSEQSWNSGSPDGGADVLDDALNGHQQTENLIKGSFRRVQSMFTNSKMLWMVTNRLKIWLSVNLEEFNRWLPFPNWIGKNDEFDMVLHWKIYFIIWLVLTAISNLHSTYLLSLEFLLVSH